MKMAPGSSGYYLFQLENTRNEALDVTVSFEESGSMAHLPLKFTLTPQGQMRRFRDAGGGGSIIPENQDCGKGARGLQAGLGMAV